MSSVLKTNCCKVLSHSLSGPMIGPSILCSDLSQLRTESELLLDAGADFLHLDVMDGHFVPNITFGHPVIKCLRKHIKEAFFESHMMVSNPNQWIEQCADAGVNQYTFHIEPCKEVPETCRKVREAGMQVGLAIKPETPVEMITDFVEMADVVLVMTVNPGFGGQKFMPEMMEKVRYLRNQYKNLNIEVDGGVGLETIKECASAGANWIVSGTAITGSTDPGNVISVMKSILLSRKS